MRTCSAPHPESAAIASTGTDPEADGKSYMLRIGAFAAAVGIGVMTAGMGTAVADTGAADDSATTSAAESAKPAQSRPSGRSSAGRGGSRKPGRDPVPGQTAVGAVADSELEIVSSVPARTQVGPAAAASVAMQSGSAPTKSGPAMTAAPAAEAAHAKTVPALGAAALPGAALPSLVGPGAHDIAVRVPRIPIVSSLASPIFSRLNSQFGAVPAQSFGFAPVATTPGLTAAPASAIDEALGGLLARLSAIGSGLPVESPAAWAVLEAARRFTRQIGLTLFGPSLTTGQLTALPAATTGTTTKITWNWGTYPVISFNPATDKLDFGWMTPSQFDVTENAGSTVIAVVDNNHSYTLQGVGISQLSMNNIIASDANTVSKWQNIIASAQGPAVSIANVSVTEGDSGTKPMAFTVSLSKASTSSVTVNYATANGTATAGSDYTAASGTLTFAPGVTSQTVNVSVTGDRTVEPNETFTVKLTSPSGAALGAATATGTITNDDVAPTVSIANASIAEGDSGTKPLAFTVSLSKASTSPVTVNYVTANGTATAGSDYTAASGALSFAPGVTSQTVNVSVIGDVTVEPNETFTVKLTGPSGATLGTATATGTITNDDVTSTAPTVSIANASIAEGDSGAKPMAFTVSLSKASTSPVTVNYATGDGTATAGSDYTAASGALSFAPGVTSQTVNVSVTGDRTVEPNETFTVKLASPSGATLGTATATGTITNDDVAPTVSIANSSVVEGNLGTKPLAFTVSLSKASTGTVTVNYGTANGTATAGSDYVATAGTLTFAPGVTSQTVNVAVTGDTTVEPVETFTVTLVSPTGASLGTATATGTITNDDIAPQDKVIAAYFPEWGIYGRNFQVADVPAEKLTHLIYAFADLTPAGDVVLYDKYAAVEKRFAAGETVSGEADLWYYPPEDPRSQQTVWGNFNQLSELKKKYPHLRVDIAIGGWTLSKNFSTVASTPEGRERMADSVVSFLTTYPVFDGVDFDWEYPGGGGLDGNSSSPNDGANYAELLKVVRTKLDALGEKTGRYYEITVASPAGHDKIANFNLAGLAPSVDRFNVMAYDFHGTWEKTTGHQSAFTGDPNGYDIQTAVNLYLKAGVKPSKIVLGAPLYTRGWSGVADGGDGGYAEAASGAAPGTYEAGSYDYKDLLAQLQDPAKGWVLYWDDKAQAAYLYNPTQKIFSSFETPTSIAQKSEWAQATGLAGMMFWDISNDAVGSPESLVKAAYDSWVLHDSMFAIHNRSTLIGERIIGGDGVILPLPATSTQT